MLLTLSKRKSIIYDFDNVFTIDPGNQKRWKQIEYNIIEHCGKLYTTFYSGGFKNYELIHILKGK